LANGPSTSVVREERKERKRVGGKHRRPAARLRACRRRWLPYLSILARLPSVCVDLLSYPIYFRIWTRVLSPGENRLRRVSNGGKLPFSGFGFRGCFSRWWKREATVSSWCVSVSRGCYSGVCSNGGGDDLAPAIDLAGKDFSGVQDGGDGECW
ncbi:hypothetical protein HID58_027468, partial [Brassica napus]